MNLRELLQSALGGAFTVERELTGGGMSRVFLARDTHLGRTVVIKVLPPQLAQGVSADRFEREIKLAASLQHPHIVPVLTAGTAGELLYYVMPHIQGESVAERLDLDGKLAAPEAISILRDVADALAYAHGRGVVHRDIKPANVLLSGEHGMVTDFGIAKAVGDATTGARLTGTGTALGTPAYMAPEQAAGDAAVDHRADIYSFGALAYELLTGGPPFEEPTAHAMLAAHVNRAPVPLTSRRPDVPAPLATLVMRCLEKDPAARPQTANELLRSLAVLATPTEGVPAQSRPAQRGRQVGIIAGVAAVVAAIVVGLRGFSDRGPAVDPNLMVVLPFRVAGADPALHYLREGMMDLLAAKLSGEGGPRAADPQTVTNAWRRAGGSDAADLSQNDALALARRLGAGEVLTGGIVGAPARVTINAAIVTSGGDARARASVEGPADSLPTLVDRVATQLLVESASLQQALSTQSVEALKAFLAGRAAYRRGDYNTAARQYERAVEIDSMFVQASGASLQAYGWGAHLQDQERMLRLTWDNRARLDARQRAWLDSWVGLRYPARPLEAELLAGRERLVDLARDNGEAWFTLGDEYYHEGQYLGYEDWNERARAAIERSLTLDPGSTEPLGHLIDLAAWRGDSAEVRRLAPRYLATDGARRGPYSLMVRWNIAHALRDPALMEEIWTAFDTASDYSPGLAPILQIHGAPPADLERLLAVQGKRPNTKPQQLQLTLAALTVLSNQGRTRAALALIDSSPVVPPPLAANVHLHLAMFAGVSDSAADAARARTLGGVLTVPVPAQPQAQRDLLAGLSVLGEWGLVKGDTGLAARVPARLRALRWNANYAPIAAVRADLFDALLAARRRDPRTRAMADRVDSVLRQGPGVIAPAFENFLLARLYGSLGDPARGLAVVRRQMPDPALVTVSQHLMEEVRLAIQAGDRAAAQRAFARLEGIVYNPDPEVARQVADLKRELGLTDR